MDIFDIMDLRYLDGKPEQFSVRTSKKVRKINRYCDYWADSKTTSVYRNIQPYDNAELNTLDGWFRLYRTPKDDSYVFKMRSNHYGDWFKYCFVEDTRPFTKKEKQDILRWKRELRLCRKLEKKEKEYNQGPWLTSWQLLAQYKRRVKDGAIPISRYNTFYDPDIDEFREAEKAFYYYNLHDTEEVDDAEFERLKASYIKQYGGWDKIDLDNTTYDGLAWYDKN